VRARRVDAPERAAYHPPDMPRALSLLVLLAAMLIAAAGDAAAPAGWATFRDGSVELSHPQGWRVERDPATGRIVAQGIHGERLVVWPFFVDGALDPATASSVLARMAAGQAPNATWGRVQAVRPGAVRTDGRIGADASVASLAWTPSPRGTAAQFVLASAPDDRRRETEDAFATVLGSVRLSGKPGGSVTFVRFQDPLEQAFSVEVPRGWRVTGGLVRKAPTDVRSSVVASSPDDLVHLRLGDVDLPPFAIPTSLMLQLGFREGSMYSPGYGVNMQVLRYLPGEQFARYYVTSRVGPACGGLSIVNVRPLPQTVQAMNAIMARNGSPVMASQMHAGDVAFRCQREQTPMVGYLFTETMVTANAEGAGNWTVDQLQGFLSATDRAGEAQALLAHMTGSIRLNPEWVRMQQNITAAVSNIVADTGAHISKVISDSYWSTQASQAEISRRRSNAILGVEDVRDPATGRELKVESGSSYYWIDNRGRIAGTDVDTRPNLDFRELIRLP